MILQKLLPFVMFRLCETSNYLECISQMIVFRSSKLSYHFLIETDRGQDVFHLHRVLCACFICRSVVFVPNQQLDININTHHQLLLEDN